MVQSIGETAGASFSVGIGIWLFAAFKTRIFDRMPEPLMAHTGKENVEIWGSILVQQNPTIYTLLAFVCVGFVYCVFAMFTLSYFLWSQTPWYDQMAKEIFQISSTQTTGLFSIKVFFGVVTIPVFFVLLTGLYQLAKLGLWLVF